MRVTDKRLLCQGSREAIHSSSSVHTIKVRGVQCVSSTFYMLTDILCCVDTKVCYIKKVSLYNHNNKSKIYHLHLSVPVKTSACLSFGFLTAGVFCGILSSNSTLKWITMGVKIVRQNKASKGNMY